MLLDFSELERVLAKLERGTQGRRPHSAALMFRLSLLQMFYNLSDPEVDTQAADRLSFRRFLGLALTDKVPDETSLVRFRQKLAAEGIDQELFGFIVKRATLIGATLVRAATAKQAPGAKPRDPEAFYAKKAGTYTYGYKVHLAVDADHTLIRKVALSTAKVHDSTLADEMIPSDDSLVLADKAYDSNARRARLGHRCAIMRQSYRHKKVTAAEEAINALIKPIRAGIEKVFGYWKHWVGYTRVRYRGLRANLVELHLRAIAYNLLRVSNLS